MRAGLSEPNGVHRQQKQPQVFPGGLSSYTVKPVLNVHSKRRQKIGFQDRLLLNAGQKYCRMLQTEHSAILLTFIKLLHVIKIFVLSILEWPLKTGFYCTYMSILPIFKKKKPFPSIYDRCSLSHQIYDIFL